jgi:hypothetical protein
MHPDRKVAGTVRDDRVRRQALPEMREDIGEIDPAGSRPMTEPVLEVGVAGRGPVGPA